MNFSIDQWNAWAPGLDSADAWADWCASPQPIVDDEQQQPAVSFLPAMQRRRLSRLARMVCHIAWPLAESYPALPLVFASRHGETPRTLELIQELARGEALSPTQFSLSVHNAIIGLWSILRGDSSEMTAMAAEGDGLEQAMLEATGLLAEGAPAVLLVIAEETPPALYRPYIDDVPFSYALALLLKPGDQWSLQLEPGNDTPSVSQWPHAINLLRALHGRQSRLEHHWKHRKWVWSCSKG
ncbi:beta-ketoacyl synthase chain length factor [Pseudomonas sp. ABC1]|uniref:beta-ketoacyl synthase chain length factor n=1 Tax=Pseudomonas sp. ABC1 TaxID=2748080 RepID=UPI0015C2CDDF|nr:beta-ketoacyl synthase chain length factor [Pseudomonas sp. ABC1]QLF94304.1 beta-ketoacyl synthase chain length factor [Pseudomonas sp. ABC1]